MLLRRLLPPRLTKSPSLPCIESGWLVVERTLKLLRVGAAEVEAEVPEKVKWRFVQDNGCLQMFTARPWS